MSAPVAVGLAVAKCREALGGAARIRIITAAIVQCLNYLYRIELQSNSVDFLERVEGTKTVKPQCLLVYGRSNEWGEEELKALRILNASYHQLHIITYDQLFVRAKQLLGIEETVNDLPF